MYIIIFLYLHLLINIKQLHFTIIHPNPYDIPFLAPINTTNILATLHQFIHLIIVPIPQIHRIIQCHSQHILYTPVH